MPRTSRRRRQKIQRQLLLAAGAAGVLGVGVYLGGRGSDRVGPPAELPGGKLAVEEPATAPATGPAAQPAAADPGPAPRARTAAAGLGGGVDPALLAEADRLIDAGDLLAARKLLAQRLQANDLDTAAAGPIKRRMQRVAEVVTFSPRPFAADPHQGTFTVPAGGRLAKLARPFDVPWQAIARINGVNPRTIRAGQSLKTPVGPFHAVVDKGAFTLDLYLGDPLSPDGVFLKTYDVGLGEEASTPTGLWKLRPGGKLEDPTWTNPRTGEVVAGDDPENPLGERWIALDGVEGNAIGQQSYGIHGTIEPDTIGTNASMGCVRMLPDDVAEVYDYLEPGKSTVRVVE